MPTLLEAIAAAGGEIANAREYRPTFDEVFEELVVRRAETPGADRTSAEREDRPASVIPGGFGDAA